MKRALISGITGQDGRYLAADLTAAGIEVHGIARQEIAFGDDRFADLAAPPTFHLADLADRDTLSRIVAEVRPDFIYNLGGMTSVAQSWSDPLTTARVTGEAVATLLDAAWRLNQQGEVKVSFLQASSSEIFGVGGPPLLSESSPVRPSNPYGAAKAFGHHLAAVYRERGLDVSTCILFNHESPIRPTTFVTRKITSGAARIGRDGGGVIELGNLDARRDWGWAPDYVKAMISACESRFSDDFVVATGVSHSVADFAEAALRRAGVGDSWRDHVVINPQFFRPVDAPVQVGDASKAVSVLGWTPSRSFTEIVNEMVDFDIGRVEATPL